MKIFLTGGSGFVGSAFARAAENVHHVIALSRSETSDRDLVKAGAKPVRGALGAITPDLLFGCDAVVHCAAYVADWGPWSTYWTVNAEGTRQLLASAREAGVKRFVHIGTEAALLKGQDLHGADETYPLALNSPFPYSRTKAYAEKYVREAHDPVSGFETIVLRPRFIWGPGDKTLLPALRQMTQKRAFVWIDGGRAVTSTTYIGNLLQAMDLALVRGRSGEAYFVLDPGGPISFRDMLTRMAMAAGFELDGPELPGPVVRRAAYVLEKAWRCLPLPGRPPLTRFTANILSRDCILTDEKARGELGYRPPFSRDVGFARLADSVN